MKYISPLSLLSAIVFPALVAAQAFNASYPLSVIGGIMGVVAMAVPVLVALALALFIWGLVIFISHSGDEKAHEEGRNKMVWGIVSLFVIVSVWGLVALMRSMVGFGVADPVVAPPQASFGGGGAGSPSGGGGGGGGSGGGTLCGGFGQPSCALCDSNCDNSDGVPSCDPWSCALGGGGGTPPPPPPPSGP